MDTAASRNIIFLQEPSIPRRIALNLAASESAKENQMEKISMQTPEPNSPGVLRLEALTLLALTAIIFACVAPLLEEWYLFRGFKDNGIGYVAAGVYHTFRPLHLIPYAMQWILSGRHYPTFGVAAGTTVLLLLRYFAARWAVSPLLSGYSRWTMSTMAAALFPWGGAWLGRYAASQMSVVFFFLALGCATRLYRQWSATWAALCALCVLLLLATYQGLFLCLAVMPLATLLWRSTNAGRQVEPLATTLKAIIRLYLVMALGGGVYALYWFLISRVFGAGLYEEGLAAGAGDLSTIAGVVAHVKAVITTCYIKQPTVLPLLLAIVLALCMRGLDGIEGRAPQWHMALLILLCVALMPLTGLIYVNVLHLNDPERIEFPLSISVILLASSLLAHFSTRRIAVVNLLNSSIVVLILVISSGLSALTTREDVLLQQHVLDQASRVVKTDKPRSLVIEDMTGKLGDVYTFYQDTLSHALAVKANESITTTICTPLSVDRIHPVAKRFPITSTQRCEDLPQLKGEPAPGLLVTRWNGEALETVAPK